MSIDHATPKIPRPEYTQKFWKRLEGRSHFPLYFASKDSPLDWRGCLVFSALAYHGRLAKSKVTYAKLSEMTGLYRETVPKIVKSLQGHGLLDVDLRVIEPEDPGRFFVLKGKTPLERSWTDKLVYSWFYILDEEVARPGLQPFDVVMMALLVGRMLAATTASYLATSLGTTRKSVSSSLVRLAEQGLSVKSGPNGIRMGYENFLPDPAFFLQTRKLAKGQEDEDVIYPDFLIRAVKDSKIPESYLSILKSWVEQTAEHLFPYDWSRLIIDKCWQEHQTFKEKKGVPYPSKEFIHEKAMEVYNNKSKYATH